MASLSSLNFRLTANIKPFKTGLDKASRAMDRMGRKMQQTGKNLSMKLTAPLTALGAVSFNVFKNFEAEMSKVQAVSGATAEEFKALSDNAKELGASTMFSAREVASLQTEFAKLGFSATEITKVTGATLALAQASGSDLARAAEVAGSTLRAFGLDASETGRVTDVMAASFSSSALDMNLFADSMKFVAPVAKSAGMSIEETSAMLAVLANAGIKGSQAGTALRRIISEIGATGKPTAEALKDLAAQGLNLADAKDEVGRSAQSALLVLAEGVDQIAPTTEAFKNSAGAAQKMADIMGDTAFGASKRLQSAIEGLSISIGEIIAVAVVPLIEGLASLASRLNNLNPTAKRFAVVVGAIVAAAGPLVFITGGLIRNFRFLKVAILRSNTATKAAIVLQKTFGAVMKANPVGIAVTAVTALAGAFLLLNKRQKETEEINKGLSDSAKEEIADNQVRLAQANNLIDTINDQNVSNEQRSRLINRLNTEYKDLLPNLIHEKDSVNNITTAQKEMNKQMAKKIAMIAAQDEMNQAIQEAVAAQKAFNEALKSSDEMAVKSQDLFGRVLSPSEALRISKSVHDFTSEQVLFAQSVVTTNTMLDIQKTRLDNANDAVVKVGENVNALANKFGDLGTNAEDAGKKVEETFQLDFTDFEEVFDDNFEADDHVEQFGRIRESYSKTQSAAMDLADSIGQLFEEMAISTAVGLGEMIGAMAVGQAGMKDFGSFILNQFATMFHRLGEMFIEYGVALMAFKKATITMQGPLAIMAGIALVAIGAGIRAHMNKMAEGKIPAMAEGGIVTGPTLALIGEGRESEAVIPLSKLNSMMQGGGNGSVEVFGRLSGADILLSTERAERTRTRQRGF